MAELRKHVVNLHSAKPGDPLTPLRRRACDRCRQRKSRCDGGEVCTDCRKAGASCQYVTKPKRRGPRSRIPSERKTSSRLAPLEVTQEVLGRTEEHHRDGRHDGGPDVQSYESNRPTRLPRRSSLADTISFGQDTVENCSAKVESSTIASVNTLLDVPDYPSPGKFPEDVSLDNTFREALMNPLPSPLVNPVESDFEDQEPVNTTSAPRANYSPLDIPSAAFGPYIELFFLRLYPIFPVLDQELLQSKCQAISEEDNMSFSEYALVTALSAAVVVQLNVPDRASLVEALSSSGLQSGKETPYANNEFETYPAEFFVSQCLTARESGGFIESPDENTIMTSFFLFAYFGNIDRQRSAWYYLREAISFALLLGLDDEDSYSRMSAIVSQRRRRIFWLLFVTERAFALQHRSGVMLRASPALPNIFASEDPKLIYGFVHLVSIYKKIDESFIIAWKTQIMPANIPPGTSYAAQSLKTWLDEFQRDFDHPRALAMLEMDETQRLDIMVTQSWVRMLVWQLGLRRGLLRDEVLTNSSIDLAEIDIISSKYPLRLAYELLNVVSSAERGPLEAHGIGMEQKVFDVACALSDVLRCSSDWGLEIHALGRDFLHRFMDLLARFRNQESQYLQPLMDKVSDALDTASLLPQFLSMMQEREDEPQPDGPLPLG